MINNDLGDAAATDKPIEPNTPPPSKRRVLLYALTPVVLIILLSVGMRMASEAAARQTAQNDAREKAEWRGQFGNNTPRIKHPPPPNLSHTADKATQTSIEAAVRGQVSAIHEGDFKKALSFAEPMFRAQMTPDRFGQMIRSNYSPLLDARHVVLKPARVLENAGPVSRAMVEAMVEVGNGKNINYSYMLMGEKGDWRVQGVMSRPSAGSPIDEDAPSRAAAIGRPNTMQGATAPE